MRGYNNSVYLLSPHSIRFDAPPMPGHHKDGKQGKIPTGTRLLHLGRETIVDKMPCSKGISTGWTRTTDL